jgi:hypothetical protein
MTVINERVASAPGRLADRPRAHSGLSQLAVVLALAFALGACAVSGDAPRTGTGLGSAQVQPKPPVKDYPSQH